MQGGKQDDKGRAAGHTLGFSRAFMKETREIPSRGM